MDSCEKMNEQYKIENINDHLSNNGTLSTNSTSTKNKNEIKTEDIINYISFILQKKIEINKKLKKKQSKGI